MAVRDARRSMGNYAVAAHAEGVRAGDERMERYHAIVGRRRTDRRVWPGAAFIVEALLLLVFLAGSLAVLMNLNAEADATGRQSAELLDAIVLASNAAEQFAADPVAFEQACVTDPDADRWFSEPLGEVESGSDVLSVECDFSSEETGSGTLHQVTLSVWKVRALTDPAQAAAEGIDFKEGGACFQGLEEAPVYTLETSRYVPYSARSADDALHSVVLDDPDGPPVVGLADDAADAESAPTPAVEGEVSNG